jgi:HEPN domain-containing protein
MKRKNEDLVKEWVEKADHDLGTAKLIFKHIPEYKDTICFHCQQAIEKYLKAYLIFLDIKFKFLHDLIYLLDLVKQKDVFPDNFERMALQVQSFSVEIRYPGSKAGLAKYNVKDAISAAEKFRRHILK